MEAGTPRIFLPRSPRVWPQAVCVSRTLIHRDTPATAQILEEIVPGLGANPLAPPNTLDSPCLLPPAPPVHLGSLGRL